MSRNLTRLACALPIVLATVLALGAGPVLAAKTPPMYLGPGDAGVSDMGDKALVRMSKFGPVYISGQHHNRLFVSFDKDRGPRGSIVFRDTNTRSIKSLAKACSRLKASKGIAIACRVPEKFEKRKMFVQVWTRLGDDYVNARKLPAKFRVWFLGDAGRDVFYGGKGGDFFNGAFDSDRAFGGPGNDFLRSGEQNDMIRGGLGRDNLSCGEGYDTVHRAAGERVVDCEVFRKG